MKNITLLLALAAACSGCATANTIEMAKGSSYKDDKGQTVWDREPKPGYYALLPLSVPFDIATSPIQLLMIPLWIANSR